MSDDVTGDLGAPQPRRVWGQELGPSQGYAGIVPPHRHPDKTVASLVWEDVAPNARPNCGRAV